MNRGYRTRFSTSNPRISNMEIIEENTITESNNNFYLGKNSCNCAFDEEDELFHIMPELAQSYVPIQFFKKTFLPEIGLEKGSIFPELFKPYKPCQSLEEIAYIEALNKKEECKQ